MNFFTRMDAPSMTTSTFRPDPPEKVIAPSTPAAGTTLYYEDLAEGQCWQSPSRQITKEDVASFSSLTGDFDPLHGAAQGDTAPGGSDKTRMQSPFGAPVAHGLLGLSILAGLSAEHPRAATLALVGILDWHFENPIFFDETVHVVTEIETIAAHGRRAGRVTWLRKLISSDGRLLQQGRFVTLVASIKRDLHGNSTTRSAAPRRPR
ncbi:MaoC/PaaZ C-terminal domain-containing protein [Allorhodopirellula solitaria]|uniref:Bifunctional aldehyde dehydrogenase/enoyl-CoA hydratase n=1 Tax=Allorhodopirellula solitaria TaxID=2527987 RepID=A0A5C5YI03_9BACT|nr:MaoC/PaaZ C-terminal domain-containing protein [Allorhodopirellula solitaria]TWT73872.1 bifunctional aldehyde dehydrogenase/enoyl-CoA hydratase [Allorhodopirellula solitaria]